MLYTLRGKLRSIVWVRLAIKESSLTVPSFTRLQILHLKHFGEEQNFSEIIKALMKTNLKVQLQFQVYLIA